MHPLVRSHAGAIAPVRNLSRRRFMQGAGGLVLGIALGPAVARAAGDAAPAASGAAFAPNAFVRIGTDGTVTVLSKHLEMGQGAYTGLATLLAEELDADWASIRVEGAPADTDLYKNLALGVQGTGGSTAIANSYEQMRRAAPPRAPCWWRRRPSSGKWTRKALPYPPAWCATRPRNARPASANWPSGRPGSRCPIRCRSRRPPISS